MSDTPTGETVNVEPTKNDATPAVQAPEPKAEDNAVEQLKKELEQARMRANQLENEKKAREEAEAKAKEKELEEQNQFKDLFEQEKAKREALEQEQATKERQAELDRAKAEALNGFSDEVKQAAEKLGLTLLDTDEASVTAFKEKLEVLGTSTPSSKVTPNNPQISNKKSEVTVDQIRSIAENDDDKAFHDLVTQNFPGIAAMTGKSK